MSELASESDLRAALRDGEGGDINVDHLIVHAQATAAERRVRLLSGAAIAAVVLGTGVGIGVLAGTNRGDEHAAASEGAGAGQAVSGSKHSAAGRGTSGGAVDARSLPRASAAATSCPTTMPKYLLPGGGGLSVFGADGPLFAEPVSSVVVCAYGDGKPSAPVELTGAPARQLTDSLESASKTVVRSCPYASEAIDPLAVRAFDRTGQQVGTVTTTPSGCGSQVTNGTAVRFGWRPPSGLRGLLPQG